ncbi:MAG TPA: AAA family ATPase [Planctomycetes bacterium]|nr:AAA family ATPase [Planctomycetota bacterium]
MSSRDSSTEAPAAPAILGDFAVRIRAHVARTVVGLPQVLERVLISLLTGGHLLLEGVPGTAKTLMVQSISHAIELAFGRIQFTIDLLPSDIIGSEILDKDTGEFRVHKGPIFTNLMLADEINRASPKVQSALLEAMQERKVTIGDQTYVLPAPFLVIATQNPVEQAGTFDLPEAQLDRFLMRHRIGYLDPADEAEVLKRALKLGLIRDKDGVGAIPMTAFDAIEKKAPLGVKDLTSAMESVQKVHVSEVFVRHCVDLVEKTRHHPDIELGGSPRAGIALVTASRARAFLYGRDFVVPEDFFTLAEDILLHRIRLSYEAVAAGRTGEQVLAELLDKMA